jgi:hypothetical protein
MEFGTTITNPLLQVAVSAGEATIRHACGCEADLSIATEMLQFADGRDAIQVTLRAPGAATSFTMLLRNYFDRPVLWRVARRAWNRRLTCDETQPRHLLFGPAMCAAGMN